MAIDESTLSKGQIRKLNILRKSVGDKLGEQTFGKWLKNQLTTKPAVKSDPVAEKIIKAIKPLEKDASIKLGNYGYVIKKSKGKGAKGFVVKKVSK